MNRSKRGVHSGGGVRRDLIGFLEALRRRKYSPRTLEVYGWALRDLAVFLGALGIRRTQDVTARHLDRYRQQLVERGLRPASMGVMLRAAHGLFAHLAREQRVFINPAEGMPKVRHQRRLLPVPGVEEIARLLNSPDTATPVGLRDRALLETAYATGARRRELVGLQTGDLDFRAGTVRLLGKGERERLVPLGTEAARWLGRYMTEARPRLLAAARSDALWIAQGGVPLGYGGIAPIVRRYALAAGLRSSISPHSLRRACATHMLGNGAHPAQIQALLGHASLRHLSQYLRLTITEIKAIHAGSRPGG